MFGPWASLLVAPGPTFWGPFLAEARQFSEVLFLCISDITHRFHLCVYTAEGRSVAVGAEAARVTRLLLCLTFFVACGIVAHTSLTRKSVTRVLYGIPFGFSYGLVFDIWYRRAPSQHWPLRVV